MRRLLGEILTASGLSPEKLKKSLDLQQKKGGRIGTLLVRLNYVTEEDVLKALGEQLGLSFQPDLGEIDRDLAVKLPITYAKKAMVLPLRRENGSVLAATSEPLALSTVSDLSVLFGSDISLCLTSSEKILDAVNRLFSEDMNRAEDTAQEMEEEDLSFLAAELEEPTDLLEASDDAPIIRLVNSLLSQAIRERASDIHIEPFEKDMIARFRIDGVLYNILTIKKRFQASIASRIKIMSGLNIAEKRLPQDGGMRIKIGGNAFKPWLKYYMEYELGGNALLDMRFMVEKSRAWRIKVGQWKAQYSRERIISSGRQQMMERSIINRAFTIDRQQGVSLYGQLVGQGAANLSYWVSVFTGMGRGARSNDDEHLMYMARVQWNFLGRVVPFTGSDWEYNEAPAAQLIFAAVTNRSPYTRFSTSGGGQLVGFEDGAPGQYRVNQWLQETAFKYRGFAWQQEFHWKQVTDHVNETTRTLIGTYFQAGYFFHYLWEAFPRPLELAGQVALFNPDTDLGNDLLTEYSFAANWFFNGHLNKLTADITYFNFDFAGQEDQSQWRFRVQWDVST